VLLALDPEKSIYQFNCQSWSRLDGQPVDRITSLTQSQDGYIWLGSQDGLVRFDGTEFKTFTERKYGVGTRAISDISSATDGKVWISFRDGGFGSFDGSHFDPLRTDNDTDDQAPSNAILRTVDGVVWTGSTLGWRRFPLGGVPEATSSGNPGSISCLSHDAQGRVWIGTTGNGLSYWFGGESHVFPDTELKKASVLSVASGSGGDIWVATSNGLYRYDSKFRRKEILLATTKVTAILVDSHGVVWAGTEGTGLGRFEEGNFTMFGKNDGLGSDNVRAIIEDAEGSLWVATAAGLTQLSDVKFPIYGAREGFLPGSAIAVSTSSRGGLWTATKAGVAYFNPRAHAKSQYSAYLPNTYLVRVFEARNGDVYCCDNARNIFILSGDDPPVVIGNDNWAQAFAEDGTSVLVAIGNQLFRIKDRTLMPYVFEGDGPHIGWIFSICVARDGVIWVGTNQGILKIKAGKYQEWSTHDGLVTNHIDSVMEDAEGAIWASTIWGIIRVKDGHLTMITEAEGLSDNRIFAIVPDDVGFLWLDSAIGLQRISRQSVEDLAKGNSKRVVCQTYRGRESIESVDRDDQAFLGCKTTDGRIWFPSPHGIILKSAVEGTG
jgi:ligand-binding sensor domain-containing protein